MDADPPNPPRALRPPTARSTVLVWTGAALFPIMTLWRATKRCADRATTGWKVLRTRP